jgi:hypothetical protein
VRENGLFGRKGKKLAVLLAQQDSIRVADSLKRVQNRLKAMEEARLDSIKLAEDERMLLETRQKYNIVVGSFLNHDNAVKWLEEYRNQGFDPEIIQMHDSGFELVVAESFERFSTAAVRLDYFQDEIDIDSWLFIRK